MNATVATRIAYALEGALNKLVYRDGFNAEDIVEGLLAVTRNAADLGGLSLQDLRNRVESMMDEAVIDLAPEEDVP